MSRGGQRGIVRLALVWALLLVSLSWVVWRQSRALDALRALDGVRRERAELEAERVELLRRLERAESRSRIVRSARSELGMRVPTSTEIVILRVPERGGAPARRSASPAEADAAGGGAAVPVEGEA